MTAACLATDALRRNDRQAVVLTGRRLVASFTALCILFKFLGVLVFLPASPADGTTRIPVCTAEGLKWVAVTKDGEPASKDASAERPCLFCLAGAGHVPFVVPLPPAIAARRRPPERHIRPWTRLAPRLGLAAQPPPSRAPPLSPTH